MMKKQKLWTRLASCLLAVLLVLGNFFATPNVALANNEPPIDYFAMGIGGGFFGCMSTQKSSGSAFADYNFAFFASTPVGKLAGYQVNGIITDQTAPLLRRDFHLPGNKGTDVILRSKAPSPLTGYGIHYGLLETVLNGKPTNTNGDFVVSGLHLFTSRAFPPSAVALAHFLSISQGKTVIALPTDAVSIRSRTTVLSIQCPKIADKKKGSTLQQDVEKLFEEGGTFLETIANSPPVWAIQKASEWLTNNLLKQ
jgi:hypothetical protein